MTHELVQTQIDLNTKIETSVDSYIFHFALIVISRHDTDIHSLTNKKVYCNGEDFGTKLDLQGEW